MEKVYHPLDPIYDSCSKVLILGSMPSQKSRELGFYYAHPQNRFWRVLSDVYKESISNQKEDKINFLHKHNIALYDVLKSCDISSSMDSSIKNPQVNDLSDILKNSQIIAIFTLGKKAYYLYEKYLYPVTKIKASYIPSTSPANCSKQMIQKIYEEMQKIKDITDN